MVATLSQLEIRNSLATRKSLTFEEGCLYTGYKRSYMYKMTSSGKIPHAKPNGKAIFFDREKLDQWLLSNLTTSNEEKETMAATYLSKRN